jgi:transcriptional regulator with XRE-family HTH domain
VSVEREHGRLGQYLKLLRLGHGLTLRDVESATEKRVSNPYLSQLETGVVTNPAPRILRTLATLYEVPFVDLMLEAGYLLPEDLRCPQCEGRG